MQKSNKNKIPCSVRNFILGVPFNLGAGISGTEFSIEYLFKKYPELKNIIKLIKPIYEKEEPFNKNLNFVNSVVSTSKLVSKKVIETIKNGYRPIIIGGDHSISLGSKSGVLSLKKDTGVIWIDAHSDLNTSLTTPSGNIHGMVLASLMGHGNPKLTKLNKGNFLKSKDVLIFGARDLDPGEVEFIKKNNINLITYDKIIEIGLENAIEEAKSILNVKNLHISFDIDAVDPNCVPGVSVPVHGGFKKDEILEIFSKLFKSYNITSVDIVELNPLTDINDKSTNFVKDIIDFLDKFQIK